MSLKINQILSTKLNKESFYYNTSRQTDLAFVQELVNSDNNLNIAFTDKKIIYNFSTDSYYYLKMKIKRISSEQKITLKLNNENDISQYIDDFTVFPSEEENKYAVIECVIAPNSSYSEVDIILTRQMIDFTVGDTDLNNTTSIKNIGRIVDIVSYEIYQFNNLIPSSNNASLNLLKIGVQGPYGMLMCINGEGIRIGPSGIYEIKNGYKVSFFGVALKSSEDNYGNYSRDNFIIDYQYDDSITNEINDEDEEGE